MLNNAKLQQKWWEKIVMLSGKSITISCKSLEDSGRGMDRSSCDYSNVKVFGCNASTLTKVLSRTQIK
jgi:hypothetical protein